MSFSVDVSKQSRLTHLNISGSKFGIRIESLLLPQMENIITDSNDNGLTILAHSNGNNFSEVSCAFSQFTSIFCFSFEI